ncbi:MAG: DUF1616 domain-containing protein [Candidatus Bathyarchaeota archaeon]
MVKIEEYRSLFVAGSLVLILVAAVPTLSLFIQVPGSSETFSELWLLGPTRKADGYPFNIQANESYLIHVGVANHLGHSAYYRVHVKLRNQTQPLPTPSNSSPSTLPPIYEFDIFVGNGEIQEKPLNFIIPEISNYNSSILLKSMRINSIDFQANAFSTWDEEKNGFYYQLFLELWLYNMSSKSFGYHNRFVGLWLNLTSHET